MGRYRNSKESRAFIGLLLAIIFFATAEKIQWYIFFSIKPIFFVVAGGIYVLFLITLFNKGEIVIPGFLVNLLLLFPLLSLVHLFGAALAKDAIQALRTTALYFSLYLFTIFLVLFLNTPYRIKMAAQLVLVVAFIATIYAFAQFAMWYLFNMDVDELIVSAFKLKPLRYGVGTLGSYVKRATSFWGDANNFGSFLAAILPLTLANFWYQHIRQRRSILKSRYFWLLMCIIVALILTFSRSAWFGVVFGLMFVWALWIRHISPLHYLIDTFLAAIILASILSITFMLSPDISISKALEARFNLVDTSLKHHQRLIVISLYIFAQHPIFGVGLGNFGNHTAQFGWSPRPNENPHSAIFSWLAETGIAGAVINFAIVAIILAAALKLIRRRAMDFHYKYVIVTGLTGGYLSLLASNIFYQSFTYWHYWLIQTLLVAAICNANRGDYEL